MLSTCDDTVLSDLISTAIKVVRVITSLRVDRVHHGFCCITLGSKEANWAIQSWATAETNHYTTAIISAVIFLERAV